MEQEMDENKTPTTSRNNTQSMAIEDEEGTITTRNNTQQSYMDEDIYENLTNSRNNTQQTEEMDENGENNGDLENYEDKQEERSPPPKRRKRNTKKKDEDQGEDNPTTGNKPKKRAPTTTRKKSTPTKSNDNKTPTQVKRKGWTFEDDKKLADAVLANLQDVPWSKIARENFSNRDRSSCYSRWNVMKKRLYQVTNGGGDSNKSD